MKGDQVFCVAQLQKLHAHNCQVCVKFVNWYLSWMSKKSSTNKNSQQKYQSLLDYKNGARYFWPQSTWLYTSNTHLYELHRKLLHIELTLLLSMGSRLIFVFITFIKEIIEILENSLN